MLHARVLIVCAVLLCAALCQAADRVHLDRLPGPAQSSDLDRGLKWLYKRRRGGGGDSDSDSSGGSDSSSGDSDDNDYTGGSTSGGDPMCRYTEYETREAHNPDSYGSYYLEGNGSLNNNSGGYTPEGSGTAPLWDNSTGEWKTAWDYEMSDLSEGEFSYRGGASVPYLAGETSPNGVTPRRLDLVFEMAPYYPYFGGDLCPVANSSYAYKYDAVYNWTDISLADENWGDYFTVILPIYCCCALNTPCGCDDHHRNSSFVPVLLEQLDMGYRPNNSTNVCNVTIDGEMALIVNGSLANGSTKADPDMEPTTERALVTATRVCSSGDSASGAVRAWQIFGREYLIGWLVVSVGFACGMGLVLV